MLLTLDSLLLLFQASLRLFVVVYEGGFSFGWEKLNLVFVEVVVTPMAVCGTGTFWVGLSAEFFTQ